MYVRKSCNPGEGSVIFMPHPILFFGIKYVETNTRSSRDMKWYIKLVSMEVSIFYPREVNC